MHYYLHSHVSMLVKSYLRPVTMKTRCQHYWHCTRMILNCICTAMSSNCAVCNDTKAYVGSGFGNPRKGSLLDILYPENISRLSGEAKSPGKEQRSEPPKDRKLYVDLRHDCRPTGAATKKINSQNKITRQQYSFFKLNKRFKGDPFIWIATFSPRRCFYSLSFARKPYDRSGWNKIIDQIFLAFKL